MNWRAGPDKQRTIATKGNENLIKNLICSQEDNTGSHMSPRMVEKNTSKSRKTNGKEKKIKAVQTFGVKVRKKDKKKEPEPWQIGLGKVALSKNVYGKMKRVLYWMLH